jgi:hypothetical protein
MMGLDCAVEDLRKKAMYGLPNYQQTPVLFQTDIET